MALFDRAHIRHSICVLLVAAERWIKLYICHLLYCVSILQRFLVIYVKKYRNLEICLSLESIHPQLFMLLILQVYFHLSGPEERHIEQGGALRSFEVILGHRNWYQSKVRMQFLIRPTLSLQLIVYIFYRCRDKTICLLVEKRLFRRCYPPRSRLKPSHVKILLI